MANRQFTHEEQQALENIIFHRRDVRGNRFIGQDVSEDIIDKLLFAALHAPSVGFSQPWEFVIIRDKETRLKVKNSFDEENIRAGGLFGDEQNRKYAKLKLEGIVDAPVNIAVFYKPAGKPILGQTTMQEMGEYSVVCAVQNMWLMSRALNVGMGWVSILEPEKIKQILNAPRENQLVAYLCVGHVNEFLDRPELEMLQWEERKARDAVIYDEKYQTENERTELTGKVR